jgi:EAL domain-containing protein (putative c-di-GMP-specific phosphodiesterase class I)
MSKSLGIKVIAEGVETEEQLASLKSLGCEYIQGYFFSKPLSSEEILKRYAF